MIRPAALALALLLAAIGPATAQPALTACEDERRPAQARLGSCTQALRLALPDAARARALAGRADALFAVALQRSEAQRGGDPDASLPPAALDPALADIEEALRLGPLGQMLVLRATILLWRGDLSDAARRSMLRGDNEGVVRDLTAVIDAGTGGWEHFVMRGANRAMAGIPGSEADFAEARRLLTAPQR
ncbi:hypothetical protein J5Y09_01755 [Roseomonas sp. PWR1]|uniref:Uncharacterized protein n=1 Tax=Roseomonas nitratireducens TaxID=2820810 RepID=A0ABS4AMP2_9PROT|nr:hypothetical protein [Neoroseomonas nitratireducens]MBP0462624.1 hypothetical protein [Neoroseomonas nitratireducens]